MPRSKSVRRQVRQQKPLSRARLLLELLEDRTCPTAVAILGADESSWIADVQAKVAGTGFFSSVTAINVRFTTPTLAQLGAYDSVLVWNDYPFADSTTLGNNLARATGSLKI